MPRKIRELKQDLRRAGFVEDTQRGKGSHSWWRHPEAPGIAVNVAGRDGADARQYQEREVRDAIRAARAAREAEEEQP